MNIKKFQQLVKLSEETEAKAREIIGKSSENVNVRISAYQLNVEEKVFRQVECQKILDNHALQSFLVNKTFGDKVSLFSKPF